MAKNFLIVKLIKNNYLTMLIIKFLLPFLFEVNITLIKERNYL